MGSEYIAYNLKPKPIASFRIHFQLNFRTINPTGLLVYSQGSSGDYIHLQLLEGTLRWVKDYKIANFIEKAFTESKDVTRLFKFRFT